MHTEGLFILYAHLFQSSKVVNGSSSQDPTTNHLTPAKRKRATVKNEEPTFYQSVSSDEQGPSTRIKKEKFDKSG